MIDFPHRASYDPVSHTQTHVHCSPMSTFWVIGNWTAFAAICRITWSHDCDFQYILPVSGLSGFWHKRLLNIIGSFNNCHICLMTAAKTVIKSGSHLSWHILSSITVISQGLPINESPIDSSLNLSRHHIFDAYADLPDTFPHGFWDL